MPRPKLWAFKDFRKGSYNYLSTAKNTRSCGQCNCPSEGLRDPSDTDGPLYHCRQRRRELRY